MGKKSVLIGPIVFLLIFGGLIVVGLVYVVKVKDQQRTFGNQELHRACIAGGNDLDECDRRYGGR